MRSDDDREPLSLRLLVLPGTGPARSDFAVAASPRGRNEDLSPAGEGSFFAIEGPLQITERRRVSQRLERLSLGFLLLGLSGVFVALPHLHADVAIPAAARTAAVIVAYLCVAIGAGLRLLAFRA